MNELQLYKFIDSNGIEYRWISETELFVWIPFHWLKEFCEMLGPGAFVDTPISSWLKFDCVCIDLADVCDNYLGFDPHAVFPKESSH